MANDPTLFLLTGATPRDTNGNPLAVAAATYAASPPRVPLRYGTRCEFRCRLADLTGGGPTPAHEPAAPAPVASTRFLRHVPPKSVRLETDVPKPAPGDPTPAVPVVEGIDHQCMRWRAFGPTTDTLYSEACAGAERCPRETAWPSERWPGMSALCPPDASRVRAPGQNGAVISPHPEQPCRVRRARRRQPVRGGRRPWKPAAGLADRVR
jgi:hypothetical protein